MSNVLIVQSVVPNLSLNYFDVKFVVCKMPIKLGHIIIVIVMPLSSSTNINGGSFDVKCVNSVFKTPSLSFLNPSATQP